MTHPWRAEGAVLVWGLAAAFLIGWLENRIDLALMVLFGAYLGRHLYYLRHLLAWLQESSPLLPDGTGIWAEVFHRLRLMQRRHQRRKRRLGKMLKRFRQATEALPDATVVLDENFTIEWFNPAAAQLLGLRKRDMGLRIHDLLRSPRFVEHLRRRRFEHPITLPAPPNERLQLEIRVISYTKDRYLLIAQDVTQIRLLERQRRDFVAHASHELRTPITVLKGYLETLIDTEEAVSEPFRPVLERMDQQIRRLQYLIDDLLYLGRLETSRNETRRQKPVDVGRLLDDIRRETEQCHDRHAPLQLEIASPARLLGNEEELRSAFSNLIVNAVKYTPADGSITIRWYETDDGACLEVSDTGEGIEPEHLPRLTERFYRAPGAEIRNPTGTGLGLAIVKHVLNRHDGRLEIDSRPGHGSQFRCHFPSQRVCP